MLALLWTSRRAGVSCWAAVCQRAKVSGSNPSVCTSGIPVQGGVRGPLVTGVGADEELAIGAGAVVVVSASVDVAAAAVVSAAADVDVVAVVSTAVVCWIAANALVCSASDMVCEYQKPLELKSGSRSGGCDQVVNDSRRGVLSSSSSSSEEVGGEPVMQESDAAVWKPLGYLKVESDVVVVSIAAHSGSEYGSGQTFDRGGRMVVRVFARDARSVG
ncbi:unnamed protein product, partial [Closterium sp. NIES-53]